jgi:4-carboxymuconolactone decarboxylase
MRARRGIQLPLENAETITEETRHARGLEIQNSLYGDEVKQAMASLPAEYKNSVPDILTDFALAIFYNQKKA